MAGLALTGRVPISMAARQRTLFAVLCFVWGTTWLAMSGRQVRGGKFDDDHAVVLTLPGPTPQP